LPSPDTQAENVKLENIFVFNKIKGILNNLGKLESRQWLLTPYRVGLDSFSVRYRNACDNDRGEAWRITTFCDEQPLWIVIVGSGGW
jgi:hypothetical protein